MNTTKKIDLGKTIEKSFEIYKKNFWLVGIAFMFLTFALVTLYSIAIQTFYTGDNILEDIKKLNTANISSTAKLVFFVVLVSVTVLTAPFTAGILKMMKETDETEKTNFNALFFYVNSSYFSKIVLSTFIISIINFLYSSSIDFIFKNNFLGEILSFVGSVSISVLTFTMLPNIIFGNLSAMDAISKSVTECKSNFFQILLLIIIGTLIGYLGIFALCIGIFFSFPIFFAIQYSVYDSLEVKFKDKA
ncbi:hypothetical protein [Flavobacterium sp.]|uniref:hypothetical protein n=1 Tax=Flavobacterium sp. TaxID=239 RepID=UPI003D0FF518